MKFETLIYEIERGRARITLNRPEKRNALSYQLQSELYEALWEADNDTEVHAVILRGAGKSFCAGYDLAPIPGSGPPRGNPDRNYRGFRGFEDDTWQLERQQRLRMAIFDMHKPVIAQVHGGRENKTGIRDQSRYGGSLRGGGQSPDPGQSCLTGWMRTGSGFHGCTISRICFAW